MDTTHFAFDTKTMIQRVRLGDMRVRVSYAMNLHKIRQNQVGSEEHNYTR